MSEQHQERPGGRPPRGALWAAAIAVLAAAGIVAGLLASGSSGGSPSASAGSAGTSTPGATAPGGSPGTGSPTSPASPGQGGSQGTGSGGGPATGTKVYLTGRVTAVSATSVTITDTGPAVTAAVTRATRFSGQADSIREVRVGYHVSAEILEKSGRATVTTLRYPAAHPGNIP